jgi:hypothetical protein
VRLGEIRYYSLYDLLVKNLIPTLFVWLTAVKVNLFDTDHMEISETLQHFRHLVHSVGWLRLSKYDEIETSKLPGLDCSHEFTVCTILSSLPSMSDLDFDSVQRIAAFYHNVWKASARSFHATFLKSFIQLPCNSLLPLRQYEIG